MADRCAESGLDLTALEGWPRSNDGPMQCRCSGWVMVRGGIVDAHDRFENTAPLPV